MKICKLFIVLSFIFFSSIANSNEKIVFLDQKFIYQNSLAGKSIVAQLKKSQDKIVKKLTDNKKLLSNEESKLIAQKNIIQPEEYKKKVLLLQEKIKSHNKSRNENNSNLKKKQLKGNSTLRNFLTPILAAYSDENSISVILQKKDLVIGKKELDITDEIIKIVNTQVKKFKIN